jgi:hypothetical protein
MKGLPFILIDQKSLALQIRQIGKPICFFFILILVFVVGKFEKPFIIVGKAEHIGDLK